MSLGFFKCTFKLLSNFMEFRLSILWNALEAPPSLRKEDPVKELSKLSDEVFAQQLSCNDGLREGLLEKHRSCL